MARSGIHDLGYDQSKRSASHQVYSNSRRHSIADELIQFRKLKEQGIILALILSSALITSQLTTQAYARNITAFIHINEEAIEQDTYLDDARWTVDGKNVTNGWYDMSDAVYGDGSEPIESVLENGYSDELMIPDNATKICFEDADSDNNASEIDYKACGFIYPNQTEFHVTYPASWWPED